MFTNKLYCNQLTILPLSCKEAIFYLLPINRSIFTLEMQMAWQWLSHFTTERERNKGKDTIGLNQFRNKIACRAQPKITFKPKRLVTNKEYLAATFGPSISDFFHLFLHSLHLASIARGMIIKESREIKGI